MKITEIYKYIETTKTTSAWNRGVQEYALELLESLDADVTELTGSRYDETLLLNGASDWSQYSWGGCSLCYNRQIAARLCTPSEFKKTKEGMKRPNKREDWFDTQARALRQAWDIIRFIAAAHEVEA